MINLISDYNGRLKLSVNNKKILILEGGFNEEHEVSLNSSREIQKTLKSLKIKYKTLLVNSKNFEKKINKYKKYICFNALHGPFGEDGQIQRILKSKKIKFTHSNFISSRNCFNKVTSKKIISANKILTPKFKLLRKNDLNYENLLKIKKNYKRFVIKPSKSGSSFGIKIIKTYQDLNYFHKIIEKYKENLSFHDDIIIEEFISGKELTVSTIKYSKKIEALAVTEIKTDNTFFDYQAKYSKGYAKHFIPAKISKKIYKKCMMIAEKSHKILGCNSIARTDFIFNSKNNKIYFLEINTQPGLTSVSLLPEQAKYRNISFAKIILGILKNLN